jgi:hypothetical protein
MVEIAGKDGLEEGSEDDLSAAGARSAGGNTMERVMHTWSGEEPSRGSRRT